MQSKNFLTNKSTAVIGLGLAAIGIAYTFWNAEKKTLTKKQTVQDEILINFLKDLKAQSYPHFFLVSDIIQRAKSEQQGQQFNQIFSRIKPEVELLFQKKQSLILSKYELNIEDVEMSLELTKNNEVLMLHTEFIQLYENALEGQDPPIDLNQETIKKFDEKDMIKIMKDILNSSIVTIGIAISDLKDSAEPCFKLDQPIFMKKLNQHNLAQKKINVLNSHQVTQFESQNTCPLETFSKLTQYFKLRNQKFKKAVNDLETAYEQIINSLLNRQIDGQAAVEAAKKIDVNEIIKQLY